ncbi:hypothetical protein CALVIDRAFT_537816, partial [Calocera viscosa TUFC12733]
MYRATIQARTVSRSFSRGLVTYRYPLVGPPDAVSHLRPALYGPPPDAPKLAVSPYSVSEFTSTGQKDSVEEEGDALQWRLREEQLDTFNQSFWVENNTRFQEAKQAVLDQYPSLAPSAPPDEVAIREMEQEQALQDFYSTWVTQQKPTNIAYTREWYRLIYSSLWPGLKRQWKVIISEMKEQHAAEEIFQFSLLLM